MNRLSFSKFLLGATLAATALGAATAAQARPEVSVSIGVQSGPAWVGQAPVYGRPQPVYVQPAPVYVRPPVFVPPRWGGHDARHQWERERARRHAEWLRHQRFHDDHGHRWGHRD